MTQIVGPTPLSSENPANKAALVISVGAAVLSVAVPPAGVLASVVALIASPPKTAARVVALIALGLSILLTVIWGVAFYLVSSLLPFELGEGSMLDDPIIDTPTGEGPGAHPDGDVAFEVYGYVCEDASQNHQECVVTVEATNTGQVPVELDEADQSLVLVGVTEPVAATPLGPAPNGPESLTGELAPGASSRAGVRFLIPLRSEIASLTLRSGLTADGVRIDL